MLPHPSPYYHNLQEQLNAEVIKNAQTILARYEAKLKDSGYEYKMEQLIGDSAKEMIVKYTEDHDVDNLVLGRRSMGKLERQLLGSTTDYCLRHAHCNVIVVTFH